MRWPKWSPPVVITYPSSIRLHAGGLPQLLSVALTLSLLWMGFIKYEWCSSRRLNAPTDFARSWSCCISIPPLVLPIDGEDNLHNGRAISVDCSENTGSVRMERKLLAGEQSIRGRLDIRGVVVSVSRIHTSQRSLTYIKSIFFDNRSVII